MDLNDNQSDIPDIHLSDVMEVIEEHERTVTVQQMDGPSTSNGRRSIAPFIEIIEQPASKALRFRYECEGRSAGSIPGVNSTTENKTFPTIRIVGYKGRAVVVVSCVTKDKPYRPHPHNLVGRDNCKRGICTIEINNDSMTASFQNLGIQCVKRKDIDDALKMREEIRVDPFRTGFSHKDNPTSIDLNAVRLCFQAFLGGSQRGKYSILEPVVSEPIYDKKAMSDLVICRLSDASASVNGGKEIILLCEKVTKDDIQIRFFEEKDGICNWEGYADFQPSDVHKQVAICFRTPRYHTTQVSSAVDVWIQLKRPSDSMCSEPRQFKLIPEYSELRRKKQRLSSESELLMQIQSGPTHTAQPSSSFIEGLDPLFGHQISVPPPIKLEPEASPNNYLYPPVYYKSRTPSPPGYQLPPNVNTNNLFGHQAPLPQLVRTPTGISTNHSQMSGCIATEIKPTLNSQNMSPQTNFSPPALDNILCKTSPQLQCPTEDINVTNAVEETFSIDRFDSNGFMMDDNEHVLSANLSAYLQLEDGNGNEVVEVVQESMVMNDSFEGVAKNTLYEFCENFAKPN